MRNFRITVNGNSYDVAVEELAGGQAVAPAAPAPTPAAAPAQAPKTAPTAKVKASGTKVTAPMPGKILDVKVTEGKAIKKGDVLLTLEAMKMENEIMSPQDGTVETIAVQKGSNVEAGDLLVSIV